MLYLFFTVFLSLASAEGGLESRIKAADTQATQARIVGDYDSYMAYAESAYDIAETLWGSSSISTALYAQKFGDSVIAAEESGATLVGFETLEKAPRAYQRCIDIYGASTDFAMMRGQCELGLGIIQSRLGAYDAARLALSNAERTLTPIQGNNSLTSLAMLRVLAYEMTVEAVGLDLSLQNEELVDEAKAERILEKAGSLAPLLNVHEDIEEELVARIAHAEAHALHALERYQEASGAYRKARDILCSLWREPL